MKEISKRINWIDICRGWAILLVIMGHSGILNYLVGIHSWIYSFHMALFFILSGYVFSVNKYDKYNEFVIHKVKTLLLPYLIFQVLNNFVWHVYEAIGFVTSDRTILDEIIGIFLQIRGGRYASGLWFLTCLFIIEIWAYFLLRINKKYVQVLITVVIAALGASCIIQI